MNDFATRLLVGALVAFALAYGFAWYMTPAPTPPGVTVEARQSGELAKEVTEPLQIEFIKVFEPVTKTKLKLPKAVVENDKLHVVASSEVRADERPHTITTVVNSNTGEFTTYDRTNPLPWLAVNTKSEIGMYVGLKNGDSAVRLEGRQELLQVKALHVGVTASVDMTQRDTDGFVGVGAWVRW